MFPIVYLFPVVMIMGYNKLITSIKNKTIVKFLNYSLAIILIPVNLTGLAAMSQKSAGIGRMEISKYLHDHYGDRCINLIYTPWSNPYIPFQSVPVNFYLEKNMVNRYINNLCELNDSLIIPGADNFLVVRKADLINKRCDRKIIHNNFVFVKQSIPKWIECINAYYKGLNSKNILVLYKYHRKIK